MGTSAPATGAAEDDLTERGLELLHDGVAAGVGVEGADAGGGEDDGDNAVGRALEKAKEDTFATLNLATAGDPSFDLAENSLEARG